MNDTKVKPFQFKQFTIEQDLCPMKVGTDGVLLGAWSDVSNANYILDVGTGSGVIAIMLAQRANEAIVHGVEIDAEACQQALYNMQQSPWKDKLDAFHAPIQEFARSASQKYDLIVSNPPFFTGGTFSDKQDRNTVRHTVKLSHNDLLRSIQSLLSKEGKFCVILPFIEGLRFKEVAEDYNFYCTKMTEVKPKAEKSIERLLLQFERNKSEIEKEQLIIQNDKRNDWTEEYIALTGDFYLKM